MTEIRHFVAGRSRWKGSIIQGFLLQEGKGVCLTEGEGMHRLILPPIDGGKKDVMWGRLRLEADLPKESVCRVRAAASDEDIFADWHGRIRDEALAEALLDREGISVGINERDMLLYRIRGRYLFLEVEVEGRGPGSIREIRVQNPGDLFLTAFPEVYREEGSFFHRYLSVFSTIYGDVQKEIDGSHDKLDIKTADKELLLRYAHMLGFSCPEGYLTEEELRNLLFSLYRLNRRKGTRDAVLEIAEILKQGPAILRETEEGTVYLMLPCRFGRGREEKLRAVLKHFIPAGTVIHLLYRGMPVYMDCTAYLDAGLTAVPVPSACLDREGTLGAARLSPNAGQDKMDQKRKDENNRRIEDGDL